MLCNKQTKRNLAILLIAAAVLASGLALTAWADHKVGHNPGGGKPGGGGGEEPPRYTQVDLGTLGGLHCGATGINDAGQVVGDSTNIYGDYHAFLLTPEDCDEDGNLDWFCDDNGDGINDLMIDLGVLPGDPGDMDSFASGVNDSGQVVGVLQGDVDGNGTWRTHAFLWEDLSGNGQSDLGEMIDLGTLGGDTSRANAINGAGQVVGYAATAGYGYWHAFLWEDLNVNGQSDTGEMIDLGTLGGSQSQAVFINDSGQVVGYADTSATDKDGRFIKRAFLLTPKYNELEGKWVWFQDDGQGGNALMTDLGTLGGLQSWGAAMNDSGEIAGTAQINSNTNHAFLLTPEYDTSVEKWVWFRDDDGDGANDLMTDLGILKGTTGSGSRDLNNAAQVVGGSYKSAGGHNAVRKPFLWENGQMTDLNELTDSDIDIGDNIRGINNAGEIVSYSGYILLPIP